MKQTKPTLILTALLVGTFTVGIATRAHIKPAPNSDIGFHGRVDRTSVMQGGDNHVRVELVMNAPDSASVIATDQPTDLVVVLDKSGSMSGEKIQYAHAAVRELISRLRDQDRFALVAFSHESQVQIPLEYATSERRREWLQRVNQIAAGGGTYMHPALAEATRIVEAERGQSRIPRIVMISDGLTSGEPQDLYTQARRAIPGEFTISAVGIGSDFNETLMSALADHGTGNFYYLEDVSALSWVFNSEFETARETVATGVTVEIKPDSGIEVVDAAGYPLERSAGKVLFRPGTLYSGQERRVWVTLRVNGNATETVDLGEFFLGFNRDGAAHRLVVDDLPKIAWVKTQEEYVSSIDRESWEEGVATEGWFGLRQRVAEMVKGGQKAEAMDEIDTFYRENAALNAPMQSKKVDERLDEAQELKATVAEAFVGDDTADKQNKLGKSLYSTGLEGRRVGDRKK